MNLCAKNVFITFNNKAKIGDFGMAKELPESSGYVRYTEHRNVSNLSILGFLKMKKFSSNWQDSKRMG